MKVELLLVRGSCGFFRSACRGDVRDEERVWWKCDTLYFGSLAIDDGSTMGHAIGFGFGGAGGEPSILRSWCEA